MKAFPYDVSNAARDAPLACPPFPKVRPIFQATVGKHGVFELAITDRRTPYTSEEFRTLALARESETIERVS